MMFKKDVGLKEYKGILKDAWRHLKELEEALHKLQNEVDDPELEMTIGLIEGGLGVKTKKANQLIEYLSVILMEVAYSLSEINNQKERVFSISANEALQEIHYLSGYFQEMAIKIEHFH